MPIFQKSRRVSIYNKKSSYNEINHLFSTDIVPLLFLQNGTIHSGRNNKIGKKGEGMPVMRNP
jgi:hypothetical protein